MSIHNESTTPPTERLLYWVVGVIVIWLLAPFLVTAVSVANCQKLPPTFVDAYTAIGALFSGLVFAVVALTLRTQRQELYDARIREQFFQLLNTWQSICRDTTYDKKRGNDALLAAENSLLGNGSEHSSIQKRRDSAGGQLLSVEDVQDEFCKFYEGSFGALAHVFRIQYHLLKMLSTSRISDDMKYELAFVYRSTISDPILHLLLYFVLSKYAASDHRALVGRYKIFDNLLLKELTFIRDRIPEICHIPGYEG